VLIYASVMLLIYLLLTILNMLHNINIIVPADIVEQHAHAIKSSIFESQHGRDGHTGID
jgi:hypothetical protein